MKLPIRVTQIKAGSGPGPYLRGMTHLVLILHLFIGATLAGVGIVVLLVAGLGGAWTLSAAVVCGFTIAFPIARAVARAIGGE